MNRQTFERYEKKFLLTEQQYTALRPVLDRYMEKDEHPLYTISNIYFDTDTCGLIRASLEKPAYKEKLRLRAYGRPSADTEVFLELKKKYRGIVYKRRINMPLFEAEAFLLYDRSPAWTQDRTASFSDLQIFRELQYTKKRYSLRPAAMIAYDREALKGKADPDLRLTFDRNIRARDVRLSLGSGDAGEMLLPDGEILMEVKIPGAMPLWMADYFTALGIRMVSFSKYGMYYKTHLAEKLRNRFSGAAPEVSETALHAVSA